MERKAKATTRTRQSKSETDILAQGLKSAQKQMETRLRKQIRKELEVEQDRKVQDAVDDMVAKLGLRDGIPTNNNQGGIVDLEQDFFAAKYSQAIASTMMGKWMPVAVPASKNGQINQEDVVRATREILLGVPGNIGSEMMGDETSMALTAMSAAESRIMVDPHATNAANVMQTYIVGTGVEINASVQPIEDYIRSFWQLNRMERRLKNAVRRKWSCGEHYFFYFVDKKKKGQVLIRDAAKPYEILHVKTNPDDMETRLFYGRQTSANGIGDASKSGVKWYQDISYPEVSGLLGNSPPDGVSGFALNQFVQMLRYGDGATLRGFPPVYPVMRFLKYYEDFVTDRIVLNHERSKVVWVRIVKGNKGIEGGRGQYGPRGGQILTQTPQLEWKPLSANIGADDVTEDGRLIRLAIAAGLGIPEHILFQDPSNQVYASIRSQDTPFSQMIRTHQDTWTEDLADMFRVVLREGVKGNALKPKTKVETFTLENRHYDELMDMLRKGEDKEYAEVFAILARESATETAIVNTQDVKVDITFPSVVKDDPLRNAQMFEVMQRMGTISRTTIDSKLGYNFKAEKKLMELEGPWAQPPAPPNANNSPAIGGDEKKSDTKPAKPNPKAAK